MQNHDWIELFRLIPVNQHNVLVLTTLSGVELSIETIMRTELEYLVFRGRVCGSTDDGRLFFLPYRQIDFVQVNRAMKEAEVRELFGEIDGPKSGLPVAPGSMLAGSVISSPKSSLPGSAPGSAPGTAATAGRPILPVRPTATAPATAATNVPPAALVPPAAGQGNGNPAPRNSILERLRAQRNAVLPPRPPAR